MRKIANFSMMVLILFQFVFCLPQTAKAEENLTIPEWAVEANLLENGDLQITEDITFAFRDSFHGVFREIGLDKTSGVADIRVEGISKGSPKAYEQVEKAKNGDSGVFLTKMEKEKAVVQIFSPSEDEEKTFRLRYTVRNVAIRYKDTAELYYQFLGDKNETPIDRFQVNIALPRNDAADQVKIFAHGPQNGVIRKEGNAVYSLYVEDVPPNTFVEGRVVFPKEFLPMAGRIQNVDRYSAILEEETAFQKKLEADIKRKELIRKTLEKDSLWASLISLAALFVLMLRFRREKNVFQGDEYMGIGIPENCTPAVAACLTSNALSTDTIFATILDLVRRGYFILKQDEGGRDMELQEEEGGMDGEDQEEEEDDADTKAHKQSFLIAKGRDQDDSLMEHERYFMNWLLHEMGNGQSVSTRQIETFSKEESVSFSRLYYDWRNKVKEDTVKNGYYDRSKRPVGIVLIFASVALFLLAIFTFVYESPYGLTSLIMAIAFFVYGLLLLFRKSDYGYQQYRRWMQFRKYMKNHKADSTEEKTGYDSSDISLIYALALGIRKKSTDFASDFDQAETETAKEAYSYNSWLLWYFLFTDHDDNAFQKSMNSSFGAGSGDDYSGGGFSGGGGGGAGGGGAGGF